MIAGATTNSILETHLVLVLIMLFHSTAAREVFLVLPVLFFWNFQRMKNYHNNGMLVESMQLIGAPDFARVS